MSPMMQTAHPSSRVHSVPQISPHPPSSARILPSHIAVALGTATDDLRGHPADQHSARKSTPKANLPSQTPEVLFHLAAEFRGAATTCDLQAELGTLRKT